MAEINAPSGQPNTQLSCVFALGCPAIHLTFAAQQSNNWAPILSVALEGNANCERLHALLHLSLACALLTALFEQSHTHIVLT